MSTGRGRWWRLSLVLGASAGGSLLSFEGPRAGVPRSSTSAELENCTKAKRVFAPSVPSGAAAYSADRALRGASGAHRQDAKGTRWMPWHQEPRKDVDGCDKPR
jgi:hypothetical protein